MEYLIYNLINFIAEGMPELQMVDEDYGQLECLDDNKDMYPITFPAVLIDSAQTEWTNIKDLSQKGQATIKIRLILDCYDDTHYNSGTSEKILERQKMVEKLHKLVQGFRINSDGGLIRTLSKHFTWDHGIKVYETTYITTVSEFIQETTEAPSKPVVKISVSRFRNETT